jgi:hypothetical protein
MDCARMADTVSARDLARGEAGTCTEIARRALGTAWRGRLENKWGIMERRLMSKWRCLRVRARETSDSLSAGW